MSNESTQSAMALTDTDGDGEEDVTFSLMSGAGNDFLSGVGNGEFSFNTNSTSGDSIQFGNFARREHAAEGIGSFHVAASYTTAAFNTSVAGQSSGGASEVDMQTLNPGVFEGDSLQGGSASASGVSLQGGSGRDIINVGTSITSERETETKEI